MSRISLISIPDNRVRDIELILYERDMITEIQTLRTKLIEIEKILNLTKSIVLIILQKIQFATTM